VTKDISEISLLVLNLEKYRSTVNEFKHGLSKNSRKEEAKDDQTERSEGILGKVPENTESIAELMLFDSDVNVYGDIEVHVESERAHKWQEKKASKRQQIVDNLKQK